MADEAKLRAEIDNWKHSAVVDSRRLHSDRFDEVGLLPSIFRENLFIGSIYYQLDEIEQTKLWFAWGVRVLTEFLEEVDADFSRDHRVGVPRYAENAVLRAILIGQPQLRKQAIESVRSLDSEIEKSVQWDPRYHMVRVFISLATGAENQVSERVDDLRHATKNLEDGDEEWARYFRQVGDVAENIIAGDTPTIEQSLNRLLTLHDDIARERKDRTDVMDYRSGALVILARERELSVSHPNNDYFPTELVELVVSTDQ